MPILCLVDAQIFVIGGKITLYLNELSLVISPSDNIIRKKSYIKKKVSDGSANQSSANLWVNNDPVISFK